jgi:hypothetical protein
VDTTAVSVARTALYEALRGSAALASWRVHRTTPRQIAAPCIYLDSVEMSTDTVNGATFVECMFPIILVHDGAVRAQVEALDDMLAHVWTAAMTVGDPTDSRPVNLDVGGPTLRSHLVRVGVLVQAITLCPPTLVTPATSPGGNTRELNNL